MQAVIFHWLNFAQNKENCLKVYSKLDEFKKIPIYFKLGF
jgi:hypothetical protein